MRYAGIDYGKKRIGVALSDPEGRIAFPRKMIFNGGTGRVWDQLKEFFENEDVATIVVGLPIGLGGKDTDQTAEVRVFAERLKKVTTLPIVFENEMFTTKLVRQAGVQKEHVDESCAALILQSYLDKN